MFEKVLKTNIVLFFLACGLFNFSFFGEQQFSYLANSFMQGKLYFLEQPGSWGDTVLFKGNYYWPLGPFPAILLIPFVFIFKPLGFLFSQGYLQFFVVVGIFYLVKKIAYLYKYSREDTNFLAFAFCFSSVFLGVALVPWSWYFAHVVAVFITFLILHEFLTRKRYWLMGFLSGFLVLTRALSSLLILVVLIDLVFVSKQKLMFKLRGALALLLPYTTFLFVLFIYNYLRFGNPLEQGYSLAIAPDFFIKALSYGLFSLYHIPGNLYYFLLSPPIPVFKDNLSHVLTFPFIKANPWGMSIFVTSPYFLYLFFMNYKDKLSKMLLLNTYMIAVFVFLFYGIGFRQFGYRYSLDFLPLLFLVMIIGIKTKYGFLTPGLKLTILVTSLTNFYLLNTLF